MTNSDDDGGQAAVMVVMIAAALFMALSAAVLVVGGHVIDRTRAQTAADAAALGALQGGREAAAALAARHGAELVTFEKGPGDRTVIVVVRLGDATASAAASDAP